MAHRPNLSPALADAHHHRHGTSAPQPLIDFFRTGRFEFHSGVPWTGTVLDLGAAPGLDFLGINFFYSRGVFGLFCQPTGMPGDEMTEMPYGEWARPPVFTTWVAPGRATDGPCLPQRCIPRGCTSASGT